MGSSSLSAPHWRNIGIPWSRAVQSELFSETSMLAARRKNGLGVSRNSAESLSVVPVAIVTWVEPAASLTSNEDGRTMCATGAGGRSSRRAISSPAGSMTRRSSCCGPAASNDAGDRSTRTSPGAATLRACRCCHSVGVRAGQLTAAQSASSSAGRLRLRWKGLFIARQEALVGKRRQDRDHRDGEEGADAVERLEARKVVEEELEQGDAQERDGGITHAPLPLPYAGGQQAEREEGPPDGVGHVAREIAGELEGERERPGQREVVGDLDVQENEREDDAKGIDQRLRVDAEHVLPGRGQQPCAREEGGYRHAVGIEVPVEHGRAAANVVFEDRGVERQPDEDDGQQHGAGGAQARMRDAVEEPQERGALERPCHSDPLPVELDREHERDEEQRHAAEPRELAEA